MGRVAGETIFNELREESPEELYPFYLEAKEIFITTYRQWFGARSGGEAELSELFESTCPSLAEHVEQLHQVSLPNSVVF